jgi:hypothetical protein
MQKSTWFDGGFKFTKEFLSLLENPENTIEIKGNKQIKVSDIDEVSLKRLKKYLNRIIGMKVSINDDETYEWFNNKKTVKGIILKNNNKIPLYHIDKTKNNISKTQSGKNTIQHETISLMFFEYAIEQNTEPPIEKIEELYPNISETWMTSFRSQTQLLKKYIGNRKGYVYERMTGLMKKCERFVINLRKSSSADSWNPADVWIIHKSVYKETEDMLQNIYNNNLDSNEIKVQKINAFLTEKMIKKEILLISLKQISKPNIIEENNFNGAITDLSKYSVTIKKAECNLEYEHLKGYKNKSSSFVLEFSGEKTSLINLFYKEASKQRATVVPTMRPMKKLYQYGKVPVEYIDSYFEQINEKRPNYLSIPSVGEWTEDDILYYNKIYNYFINSNFNKKFNINLGNVDEKSFNKYLRMAIKQETQLGKKIAASLCAKMQQLKYLYIFSKLYDANLFEKLMVTMVLAAQRKYGDAGPFILLDD